MSSQHQGHSAEDPDLTAHSAGAPFARRAFFWLWLANTISALGTWIQNTASAWIMTDLSPSPLMVSLVQAAAQLPVLVLALPAGALADLMDRKRHLILTNMLMLAAAVILALVAALGRLIDCRLCAGEGQQGAGDHNNRAADGAASVAHAGRG
jgi:MFS family permease